jgi:hypothetical protein
MDVIFSSTEQGCEFERRVGDGEQFGQPLGQGIRVSFFLGDFIFWTSKKEVPRHEGEIKTQKI